MGNESVAAGGAEVVGGKAFQDLVGQAVGGGQREFQGLLIGDAAAIQVGRADGLFGGQSPDLRGGPVHKHDANIERAQHRNIHEDIPEVFVRDDCAVDA